MIPYEHLIAAKRVDFEPRGFPCPDLPSAMSPLQQHVTAFAIEQGCAGAFLDTGLGKTFIELAWGDIVARRTNKPVIMLAPLACSGQHAREAERWDIDAHAIRTPGEITGARVYITNYERLHLFDADAFGGVVLDESSILKSFTGKTTRRLIEAFAQTPFRLEATATPAPNDHMELGQHSEFLGVLPSNEMLSRWFISDQADMGRYRLKRGAVEAFWDWMASWSRAVSKPSDLGFSDEGYDLPALNVHRHEIRADVSIDTGGLLFRIPDMSATAVHAEKRRTIADRAEFVADLVHAEADETWVTWCETDYEADALVDRIDDAVEVRGSMHVDRKEELLMAFGAGEIRRLVTKPSVCGFGLNWQHCARTAVLPSFSYERFYQLVRRFWRFGQKRPVNCHVVMADTERAQWEAIIRKRDDHDAMKAGMLAAMGRAARRARSFDPYAPAHAAPVPSWLRSAA